MMLFKPEHVKLILEGKKTQTRRKWIKPRAKLGAVHQAKTKMFGKPFAYLFITDVHQEKLGDITFEDVKKEGYHSFRAFMDKWLEINKTWNPIELVWVVSFYLVIRGNKDNEF